MIRISVMYLARQTESIYIHLPFLKLAHQDIDPDGCSMTTEEWAAKWEAFFGIGKGEFHIADLANAIGEFTLANQLATRERQFGEPRDENHQ